MSIITAVIIVVMVTVMAFLLFVFWRSIAILIFFLLVPLSNVRVVQITAKAMIKLGTQAAATVQIDSHGKDICDRLVDKHVPLSHELPRDYHPLFSLVFFILLSVFHFGLSLLLFLLVVLVEQRFMDST